MLIQKVLGRWIALLKQNVGTTKKSYITASDLESCLKQAFAELAPEIKEHTGEEIIPELSGNPLKGESGAKIAETLRNLFNAGLEEVKEDKCNCGRDHSHDEEMFESTEEQIEISNKINSIMKETINIIKDPNISREEKIKLVKNTRDILEKEKNRLQEKVLKTSRLIKETEGKSEGSFQDFLKALKAGNVDMQGTIVKVDKRTGKAQKINLKDNKSAIDALKKLLENSEEVDSLEDLDDNLFKN